MIIFKLFRTGNKGQQGWNKTFTDEIRIILLDLFYTKYIILRLNWLIKYHHQTRYPHLVFPDIKIPFLC